MTKTQLAKRISAIVVYGHLAVFIYGLLIMLVSPYDKSDTFQMILMGSPLLAMVGLSAYRFMAALPMIDLSGAVDSDWARMATVTTISFLVALFATYTTAAFDTNINISTLKFIVGAIETILGGYLGVNRDALFPEVPHK